MAALTGAEHPEHIAELFSAFGPVAVRRMFGGAGIFSDGLMIGLVVDGVIYLKADTDDVPRFEREGLEPFRYRRKGAWQVIRSFWRMPERLYDDADELADWARLALAAARRSGLRPARGSAKSARRSNRGRQKPASRAAARRSNPKR
ncbi:MAG: TfoX/Sxy family protein [Alphaproteobacteria bacterium]|nr:TfoX/Sxy family protein [Alphaproteobacteria bacterium]